MRKPSNTYKKNRSGTKIIESQTVLSGITTAPSHGHHRPVFTLFSTASVAQAACLAALLVPGSRSSTPLTCRERSRRPTRPTFPVPSYSKRAFLTLSNNAVSQHQSMYFISLRHASSSPQHTHGPARMTRKTSTLSTAAWRSCRNASHASLRWKRRLASRTIITHITFGC